MPLPSETTSYDATIFAQDSVEAVLAKDDTTAPTAEDLTVAPEPSQAIQEEVVVSPIAKVLSYTRLCVITSLIFLPGHDY